MKDFFVSYNQADQDWAEWVAWILEEAKYSVVIQAWDFLPGENFVLEMHKAAAETEQTVAILSQNYLDAEFTHPEWAAAFIHDPQGQARRLIPVRVRECGPTGLLAALVHIDVVGLSQREARDKILRRIKKERIKPLQAPSFPGNTLQRALARVAPTPVEYPGPFVDLRDAPQPPSLRWPDWMRDLLRRKTSLLVSVVMILALLSAVMAYLYRRYYRECEVRMVSGPINITFDKFNKSQWEIPGAAEYDSTDAQLSIKHVPGLIFLREQNYFDFEMKLYLKLTNMGGVAWAVRVNDADNYYLFYLAGPENDELPPGFYFYIVRNNKFDPRNYQYAASPPIAERLMAERQYEIIVRVKGKQIDNVIIPARMKDGVEDTDTGRELSLGQFEDPHHHFKCGSIGFRTVGSGQFSIYQVYTQPANTSQK